MGVGVGVASSCALALAAGVGLALAQHDAQANVVQQEAVPKAMASGQTSAASGGKGEKGSGEKGSGEGFAAEQFDAMVLEMQDKICAKMSAIDGGTFREDTWEREGNRGVGRSMVLQDGAVFEKAGVNVSVVMGDLPPRAAKMMKSRGKEIADGQKLTFRASGISLVIHPHNPMAPTVHLNYRYFAIKDEDGKSTWWFGGGCDLTPSYLFPEDCAEFHSSLRQACDQHDAGFYPRFKKWCDEYFYLPHRDETRGVGGIFYDDLDERPALAAAGLDDQEALMAFARSNLESFLETFPAIMARRKDAPFTAKQKEWQQIRRGRYVEFNLVEDRGTKFGLATPKNARIESVLVSLPLTARWEYMHEPEAGSPEEELVKVLKEPREWAVDLGSLKEASFQDIMAEISARTVKK